MVTYRCFGCVQIDTASLIAVTATILEPEEVGVGPFRSSQSIRWLKTSQGGTFVNLNTGTCFEVNAVGGRVYSGILAGQSVDEIIAKLQDNFPTNAHVIQADVKGFIEILLNKGIIEPE